MRAVKAQTVDTAQVVTPETLLPTLRQQLPNGNGNLPDVPSPAEITPQPPSQQFPEPAPPTPLPPPDEILQTPSQIPPTPPPIPGIVPETITIERFEFEGNTAFTDEELAPVIADYTNRPISFAELFEARSAITQHYIERGYITSGAILPPQTLEGGIVTIQVVEGELEAINVTGTERLNPGYVRSRLEIATGRPLNQEKLLEALQQLQLDPLIENLSAELAAGTRPGTSLLEVRVTEAETFRAELGVDNNRSPSIGTFRRRAQLNEANVSGWGDNLSLSYSNTEGSNSLDASYTLPVNPRNGTVRWSYGASQSDVIEPPFDRLDIDASSRYFELSFRQPLILTPTEEFAFGLTASRQESEVTILELPVRISPGADEQGRTRISAARFFLEWTKRNNREVFAARSQWSFGTGAFNATVNEEAPDSRFVSWRGQAQWVRLLARDTLLLVRGDMQLADRPLVAFEQFGLGGQETIRGYRQDVLLTDNGLLASAEVRIPVLRLRQLDGLIQVVPFVDLGTAWNNGDREDPDPNVLISLGLGLRAQLGDRLFVRLDYGIPLVDVFSNERTWQENGLYFSIVANPF